MAQQVINNGETGLSVRTKINANFTELYDPVALQREYVTAKNVLLLGSWTDPLLEEATSGVGALNLVAYGIGMFAAGTAGQDRITDSVFMGTSAANNLVHGNGNVCIGQNTLGTSTRSNSNTAVGDSTLRDTVYVDENNVGWQNVAMGYVCAAGNTTGSWNVWVGSYSGVGGAGTGDYNVMLGAYTGAGTGPDDNSTALGDYNVGIGYAALRQCESNHCIGIGLEAGINFHGSQNIAIGRQSGTQLSHANATNNICIGYLSGSVTGFQKTDAVNTICIGFNTYAEADNEVVIGNTSITKTTLRGNLHGIGGVKFVGSWGGTAPTDGAIYRANNFLINLAGSAGWQINDSNNSKALLTVLNDGTFRVTLASSASPLFNNQLAIEATNNSTLTLKFRGSDGVTRSTTLALT